MLWRTFQERILGQLCALLLLGSTLLALLEVVRRYIFGHSFEWQQDAVTYFTLSGVYLYFGIAQRRDAHLSVTLIPELFAVFGPRWNVAGEVVRLIATVFSLVFLVAVAWWGVHEVRDAISYESRTESLAFPLWPFLLALLIGFAFMALTMVFQVYRQVNKLCGRSVLEEPAEEDDSID